MSKKLKLSQWHDGSVLPVNVGVYNVLSKEDKEEKSNYYSFWNGKHWNGHWTINNVMPNKDFGVYNQSGCSVTTKWRGIVK